MRMAWYVSLPLDHSCPGVEHIKSWLEVLMARAYGKATRAKRALVLVNPMSGPGLAHAKWHTLICPLFEQARMKYTSHTTQKNGHARAIIEMVDINQYDIVVACSGDGLVHEIFNGLASRPDASVALRKLAVCHVPCGSGNAMSCNLYGTHHPTHAAQAIIKGLTTPIDLVSITQGNQRTLSFLSQALGAVAEADLGTEWMRFLGPMRFTLGILYRFVVKKTYPCDVAVKAELETKEEVREHYRQNRKDCSVVSRDASSTISSNVSDSSSSAPGTGKVDSYPAAELDKGQPHGWPPLKYGTVNDPVPKDWQVVHSPELGNFYCGNVSSPAFSGFLIPDGTFQ